MGKNTTLRTTNWRQINIGVLALVIGVILYIFDRPATEVYFVPDIANQYHAGDAIFGVIGNYLPTFLHVFAFCLITAGTLGSKPREALWICVLWVFFDTAFELGQHPEISPAISLVIPDWFASIPVLDNTANYFINGHFDTIDIASIWIGATCAFLIIYLTPSTKSQI